MTARTDKPLTPEQIAEMPDDLLIDTLLWNYATAEMPQYDELRAELEKRLKR